MIVAYTDYDAVTNLLANCALIFTRRARGRVSQEVRRGDAGPVRAVLAGNPRIPFIFFGHGHQADGPLCQDRVGAFAGNLPLVADRLICAFCCFSIDALTTPATQHQATVLGFNGKFWLTIGDPALAPYFSRPLLSGLERLLNGDDAAAARQKIEDEFRQLAQNLQCRLSLSGMNSGNVLVCAALLKAADGIQVCGDPTRGL